MELPAKGSIVVVLVPTSHRGVSKARPALVLSNYGLGPFGTDFLTAGISTKETDPLVVPIHDSDLLTGRLTTRSFVRPALLYLAPITALGDYIGAASPDLMQRVTEAIKYILDS